MNEGVRETWNGGRQKRQNPDEIDASTEADESFDIIQITPDHIRANGTIHKKAFAGIAELIDNAVDSKAVNVHIGSLSVRRANSNAPILSYITVSDDGIGMNRHEVQNVIRIGYSAKRGDANTIGQFGNGLKSGSMRLGETLLLCSKKNGEVTVLLISLGYMEGASIVKCYVPIVSYELSESGSWTPLRQEGDRINKHENAIRIITQYSPFATEADLHRHLENTIPGMSGTSVLVAQLRKINSAAEVSRVGYDLVVADLSESDEGDTESNLEEAESRKEYLSKYLAQLYLHCPSTIYIHGRKVNLEDPILSLADPRWLELSKKGIKPFGERQSTILSDEITKANNKAAEILEEWRKNYTKLSYINQASDEFIQLKRENRFLDEERKAYISKSESLLQQKKLADKTGLDIKVHFGIDLMSRYNPRVVFYTNGRRICTLPLMEKWDVNRLKEVMGVVAIIDIPSTLLKTAQNREAYETPSEVKLFMTKISKLAAKYFSFADQKYKDHKFWKRFGYEEQWKGDEADEEKGSIEAYRLTGIRKQCARCHQFRKFPISKDFDAVLSLDVEPFTCPIDSSTNQCVEKSFQELRKEEIKRLIVTTGQIGYKYGETIPQKEKKKNADHHFLPPTISELFSTKREESVSSHSTISSSHQPSTSRASRVSPTPQPKPRKYSPSPEPLQINESAQNNKRRRRASPQSDADTDDTYFTARDSAAKRAKTARNAVNEARDDQQSRSDRAERNGRVARDDGRLNALPKHEDAEDEIDRNLRSLGRLVNRGGDAMKQKILRELGKMAEKSSKPKEILARLVRKGG